MTRKFTDGTFTLEETQNKNHFYFYRNDGEVLENLGRKPLDFYQEYVKMTNTATNSIIDEVVTAMSADNKVLSLTIYTIETSPNLIYKPKRKKQNILKRWINKFSG